MVKRQIARTSKMLILSVLALLFFLSTPYSAVGQYSDDVLKAGKALFKTNCKQCHNENMKSRLTGPALGGVQERWESEADLYAWIRNSQALAASGNAKALEMIDWDPSAMTAFPNLTDVEISSILSYIDQVYANGPWPPPVNDAGAAVVATDSAPSNWLYAGLIVLLGIIALILARVASNYSRLLEYKETGIITERPSIWDQLTRKGLISFLLFIGVVILGFTTVNNATGYGRQIGYAPEQPIAFSHEIHAGMNKIDCQYCHDGARRSKHAVIPAANTCMNCHKAVLTGTQTGTSEITKIFASIGFDPSNNKYIENYETLSEEEIKEIYTKWISDQYKEKNELTIIDNDGEEEVQRQWDGIVSSLTNENKSQIQGPIEWVRIHNLPDHAYFNHSQHVTVGKVACQECHGEVENMEVLQQYSPLSMGWCVNCHRETEVQFKGNEYYESYAKYHEELNAGTRRAVTVEDIGGLECQKCHY